VSKKSQAETAFGSIEGAADYLGLLLDSVKEAQDDLQKEALLASSAGAERREQAIQLANYKLLQLKTHLTTSRRILNDLRTIRRLLFAERQAQAPAPLDKNAGQFVTTAESPAPTGPVAPSKPAVASRSPRSTTTN
jgi:hypothetical protein